MCAILAWTSELQGGGSIRGDLQVREGSCWLQSPSFGDVSCGQGNLQTAASNLTTLTLLWLCYADIMDPLLMYSHIFIIFGSQTILVPSGTTSTWAGLTMASLRSQVASSASSLKWTLNRENILMLDPWSSTAGTGLLEHKCLNKHRLETRYHDCRVSEQNTPVTVDTYCVSWLVVAPRHETENHTQTLKVRDSLEHWLQCHN